MNFGFSYPNYSLVLRARAGGLCVCVGGGGVTPLQTVVFSCQVVIRTVYPGKDLLNLVTFKQYGMKIQTFEEPGTSQLYFVSV